MDESTDKPDPELQRVAELLRPLWPGAVMAVDNGHLRGRCGSVDLEVGIAGIAGFAGTRWACSVDVRRRSLHNSSSWAAGEDCTKILQDQVASIGAFLHDLHMALGLEVADG